MRKIKYLLFTTVLIAAFISGTYAAWSETLNIEGSINTAFMDVVIIESYSANLSTPENPTAGKVPYVYRGSDDGKITDGGKSTIMSVSNIYPSDRNRYQNHQLRIQNQSDIPVKLHSVEFEKLSGSGAVWDHLMGKIPRFHIEEPPPPWGAVIEVVPGTSSEFLFQEINNEIENALDGVILRPDQVIRINSMQYWLRDTCGNDAQGETVKFKLTFNWVQWNY